MNIQKGGFFKSNWAYLIWFIFYFLISSLFIFLFTQDFGIAMILTFFIYLITITIALTDIGESLVRSQLNLREVATSQDKAYLYPIFYEVYNSVCRVEPNISKNIKLYIVNDFSINALALGRNTIAVTMGAIQGLGEYELRGMIAHEFGHIAHGDTKSLLLARVGNGFFVVILKIIEVTARACNWIFNLFRRFQGAWAIIWFIKIIVYLLNITVKMFNGISNVFLSMNSRSSEYLADSFSVRIGYGQNLINLLYIIAQSVPDNTDGIRGTITSSHSFTADRIARLELIVYQQ